MKEKRGNGVLIAVAAVGLAAVFATGYFVGRLGSGGRFTVETQYEIGAVHPELPEVAETPEATAVPEDDGLININTADAATLSALPGIGDVLAERIIDYREEHGPFRITDEIMDVSGIGEGIYAEISPLITAE